MMPLGLGGPVGVATGVHRAPYLQARNGSSGTPPDARRPDLRPSPGHYGGATVARPPGLVGLSRQENSGTTQCCVCAVAT